MSDDLSAANATTISSARELCDAFDKLHRVGGLLGALRVLIAAADDTELDPALEVIDSAVETFDVAFARLVALRPAAPVAVGT